MSLVLREESGTVTVPEAALLAIAVAAAERVEGVKVLRRRAVDVEERVVRLTLEAPRGVQLLELGEDVQRAVCDAFASMCALELRVDVTIAEIA